MRAPPCSSWPLAGAHVGRCAVVMAVVERDAREETNPTGYERESRAEVAKKTRVFGDAASDTRARVSAARATPRRRGILRRAAAVVRGVRHGAPIKSLARGARVSTKFRSLPSRNNDKGECRLFSSPRPALPRAASIHTISVTCVPYPASSLVSSMSRSSASQYLACVSLTRSLLGFSHAGPTSTGSPTTVTSLPFGNVTNHRWHRLKYRKGASRRYESRRLMSNPGTKSGPVERDSPNVYTGTSGARRLDRDGDEAVHAGEVQPLAVHPSGPHHLAHAAGDDDGGLTLA